jgi:flagellar hook-length control protein FliK
MTMMSIHATPSAPSASAQPSQTQPAAAAQPALAAQAPAQAARGADAAQQAATPAPAFARVLGQQVEDSALAQAALSAVPATTSGTDGAAAADAGSGDGDGDGADSVTPDGTLLAAMAMPLMPLTPMQIAQAVQAAQGGAQAEQGKDPDAAAAGDAVGAVGQDAGRNKAISLPQLAAGQADQQINQQISQQISQQASGAARLAVQAHANNGQGNAGLDAGAQDGNADHAAAPATITVAAGAQVPAPSAQPAADTVKLAGPPTAWRQSLQEALGDRLHLQVGKNIEQAVIRLEPPQLGRIDIAIRHSAGTLEVNISASNGEVLRQLQAVSDNLRGDLSQRQFTEVAVSVTPTPKNSNAAPFGDPQQQGRGRQQGRDQDEPGRALAEASNPTSVFSLGGRE